MYLSTALVLAGSTGLAVSRPLVSRNVAAFPAGSAWDIVLNNANDVVADMDTIASESTGAMDIDLFDTSTDTIATLKASMAVICYFSAGSKEDWRPDVGDFKDGDFGQGLEGWDGEYWVNVKSENVRAIMKARIELAAKNGCSAVDPDNVDGYDNNQDGFGYDKSAYVDYVRFLASTAAANNLAIGLKNSVDIIPDVVDVMQFAVNEQCHEYEGECARYKPFTDANKAVFNIEYGGDHCDSPAGVILSTLIKPKDQGLNTLGGACASTKLVSASTQSSAVSVVSTTKKATVTSHPTVAPSASSLAAPVTSQIATPTSTSAPRPSSVSTAAKPTSTGDDADDEDDDAEDEDEDDDEDDA